MSQEPTPTEASAEGQEPEDAQGQEPAAESQNVKSYDEDYVKQLRKEAAAARTKASQMEAELKKRDDRDKTEQERLTERAAEGEQRAVAAEARLVRYEVVADRELPLEAATHLAGESREEFEASADWFVAYLAQRVSDQSPKLPGFDGGARTTPEQTKTADQAHNDFLLGVLGRNPGG